MPEGKHIKAVRIRAVFYELLFKIEHKVVLLNPGTAEPNKSHLL